jgi:hypothetical protein
MRRFYWLALLLVAGCGGGGGGFDESQLIGNWSGTWQNAGKGTSGVISGEYRRANPTNPALIFFGTLYDQSNAPIIDATMGPANSTLQVRGTGEIVSQSAFIRRLPGEPVLTLEFITGGTSGSYSGTQFTGLLTKVP